MPGAIDDQRVIDGLAALRGAATARGDADAFRPRNGERALGFRYAARYHDPERHDLVMGCIGCIAPAGEAVEMHLGQFGLQPPFQARHMRYSQINPSSEASSCTGLVRNSSKRP